MDRHLRFTLGGALIVAVLLLLIVGLPKMVHLPPSPTPSPLATPSSSAAPSTSPVRPALGALMRRTNPTECVAETSLDSGLTWQALPTPNEECRSVFTTADGTAFAYEAVVQSDTSGITLSVTHQLRQATDTGWNEPRLLPDDIDSPSFLGSDGVIYMAAMQLTDSQWVLWQSVDAGRTWESIYTQTEDSIQMVATNVLGGRLLARLPNAGQTLLLDQTSDGWNLSDGQDTACPITGFRTALLAGPDVAYAMALTYDDSRDHIHYDYCRSADGIHWTPIDTDAMPSILTIPPVQLDLAMNQSPVILLAGGDALWISQPSSSCWGNNLWFVPADTSQLDIRLVDGCETAWTDYLLAR